MLFLLTGDEENDLMKSCAVLVVLSRPLCPTLGNPTDCSPPGSSVHGILRQEHWSGLPCSSPGDLPNPGIKPRSPVLQVDSLPSEPPGKPKNTRVGSQSFLQGIFLTQESNWDLLHCRRILYQPSYQSSPSKSESVLLKTHH